MHIQADWPPLSFNHRNNGTLLRRRKAVMKKRLMISLARLAFSGVFALGVTEASANNSQCTGAVTQGEGCL